MAVRRLPCVSLLLGGVAVALQFCPPALECLQYDRSAIAGGQLWRIVTCHLTHCSFDHLVWDAGVLLLLGVMCEIPQRLRWAWCVGTSAVLIPLGIGVMMPDLSTYRGLSGIDSALFVLLAVTILKEGMKARRPVQTGATALLLGGFVAKTAYEFIAAQTVFVDSHAAAMIPVPLAHVIGGLVGLAAASVNVSGMRNMTTLLYGARVQELVRGGADVQVVLVRRRID